MESDSRMKQALRSFSDKIQDQVWFQQLKVKWDELDARTKMALKTLSLIGGGALGIGLVGMNLYAVAQKKSEIDERMALIQKIQSAQDELKRLREVTSRLNGGDTQPWAEFLQSKAAPAGFDATSIEVTSEKIVGVAAAPAPAAKDAKGKNVEPAPATGPEETVIEASVKHVNVRQLTKFVHEVENGGRTVKVRRLQVDTNPDESGFLDASVNLSAFRIKQ